MAKKQKVFKLRKPSAPWGAANSSSVSCYNAVLEVLN